MPAACGNIAHHAACLQARRPQARHPTGPVVAIAADDGVLCLTMSTGAEYGDIPYLSRAHNGRAGHAGAVGAAGAPPCAGAATYAFQGNIDRNTGLKA